MSWRRISVNSLYALQATAALAVLQWVIMAMIARRDGVVALGEYALSQAFAVPASYFAWLSLRQQLLVSASHTGAPADMMFLRVVFPLCVFGAIIALVAVAYYQSEFLLTIAIWVFAQKYVEGFFDLTYGYMQKHNNWRGLAFSTAIRCAILSIMFGVVYVVLDSLALALAAVTLFPLYFIACTIGSERLTFRQANSSIFLGRPYLADGHSGFCCSP